MLKDIQIGKQKAERLLGEFKTTPSEFNNDLLSPAAIQRYFRYYFFDRADEMAYRVTSADIGRDDNLFNLLSTNPLSIAEFRRTNRNLDGEANSSLPQSFMAAAKAFKVIDSPTHGVIVPYGTEGKTLIAELCRSNDLAKQRNLLKKAQRFTVPLFSSALEILSKEHALFEARAQTGILCLDERYYSGDLGVCLNAVSDSAALIV
jgi:CRISPR-associated endonuclease/helicase Cas3